MSNCPGCGHDAHAPKPCTSCALASTTCFQGINIVGGDGDRSAAGTIEMATGMEPRPCLMCVNFEKDEAKVRDHCRAHKLTENGDGNFLTPIARDIPGRRSLVLDPKNFGFCRSQGVLTDMLATCPFWKPVRTESEFQGRIKS